MAALPRGRLTQPLPGRVALLAAVAAVVLAGCSSASPTSRPSASSPAVGGSASATASAAATPEPTGSTIPPLPTGPDRLRAVLVADGLVAPVGIASAADGSGRLFVNEQAGVVRVIEADGTLQDEPFLDIAGRVEAGGERGLLGLAFHPDFADNGRLFVHYSRAGDGATVVSEFSAASDHRTADPASERVILTLAQPFANHNGGQLAFGPDGYLYIGLGDGGSGGDPFGNGQSTGVLLGKILRLDVDAGSNGYGVPSTNPFAPDGVRPGEGRLEIWAFGLRNPWRFSFDPRGGDLYIADVGQGTWEEIDRQPADSPGGENYGWNVMEGRHCFASGCDQAGYVKPIAEYSHEQGCSVTGGYVYRGEAQPDLVGVYVFGDYCSGLVFTLQVDEGTVTPKVVLESGMRISAFGTDESGEIYVADHGGAIYHLVAD
ncbi:MAG TPA: PQQ-dependent sugar dehydrogenase [Candidatus Limnocylindria bacterium]